MSTTKAGPRGGVRRVHEGTGTERFFETERVDAAGIIARPPAEETVAGAFIQRDRAAVVGAHFEAHRPAAAARRLRLRRRQQPPREPTALKFTGNGNRIEAGARGALPVQHEHATPDFAVDR